MSIRLAVVLTLASAALPAALGAQRNFGGRNGGGMPVIDNKPYSGQFTFVRFSYTVGPGGYYYRGGIPSWGHGWDQAEMNLMQILQSLSLAHPRIGSNILSIDDPEIFKYPVLYMTEPGFWEITDKEAALMRKYLLKGGFLIADDFRAEGQGIPYGGGYNQVVNNLARILPGVHLVDLTTKEAVFHSFYDINSFDIIPQAYDRGRPVIQAAYQDNDPTKRMLMVVNYNTDVSQFWEYSGTGMAPIAATNEAYKLGVNYFIYPLTH